ncbi:MAG: DUF3795 domain-containing protein [Planctomycetota bacterium]|nr:DUF3795 domain-containing protein [Planctomycetota bacterium]
MDEMRLVAYCGLYCDLCAQRARIPYQAKALKETMVKEGYDSWGEGIKGFSSFWEFLSGICDPDKCCAGCRQGGGHPFCPVRKCASERQLEVCVFCDEYPCKKILHIAAGYPMLIADGQRLKEIGIKRWITEQKERVNTGFSYSDIRYHPTSTSPD